MALDLSAVTRFPVIRNVTLSATPGNTTLVKLPTGNVGPLILRLRSRTAGSKLVDPAQTVADNAAIGSADYATLPADNTVDWRFNEADSWSTATNAGVSIASVGVSTVVEVSIYRASGN